jgi:hypothetical protein
MRFVDFRQSPLRRSFTSPPLTRGAAALPTLSLDKAAHPSSLVVIRALSSTGITRLQRHLLVQSFDIRVLRAMRSLAPHIRLSVLDELGARNFVILARRARPSLPRRAATRASVAPFARFIIAMTAGERRCRESSPGHRTRGFRDRRRGGSRHLTRSHHYAFGGPQRVSESVRRGLFGTGAVGPL